MHLDDGLQLDDLYVGAVNRCAPPANRPTPGERDNCVPYLAREIVALERLHVIVALGSFAWDGTLQALAQHGHRAKPKPRFGHGSRANVGPYVLLGCFHPSQQNTFTGKLTPEMLERLFATARRLASGSWV